jgi:hypothetical protein
MTRIIALAALVALAGCIVAPPPGPHWHGGGFGPPHGHGFGPGYR